MKKLLVLTITLLCSSAFYAPCRAEVSAADQATLNSYNLNFGQLNHLSNKTAFDQALALGGNVVVKFGANWCDPCQRLESVLKQVAGEFSDVLIIDVDAEAFRSLASSYGVRSYPTIFFFKNGVQVNKTTGFKPKSHWMNTITNTFGLITP